MRQGEPDEKYIETTQDTTRENTKKEPSESG